MEDGMMRWEGIVRLRGRQHACRLEGGGLNPSGGAQPVGSVIKTSARQVIIKQSC